MNMICIRHAENMEVHPTGLMMAFLISERSKEPSTRTGAVVVDANNVILGLGYNGFPRGIETDDLPWGKETDNWTYTKYPVGLIPLQYACGAYVLLARHSDGTVVGWASTDSNPVLTEMPAGLKARDISTSLFRARNASYYSQFAGAIKMD